MALSSLAVALRLFTVHVLVLTCFDSAASPRLLDDQFELPAGFHIYRAAGPELSGGSYDLCFDGQGRLLVGDGNAVRRLIDKDNDGVFDSFEAIAGGLGWRGPQGLLVDGDRLFAVGGDGVQRAVISLASLSACLAAAFWRTQAPPPSQAPSPCATALS